MTLTDTRWCLVTLRSAHRRAHRHTGSPTHPTPFKPYYTAILLYTVNFIHLITVFCIVYSIRCISHAQKYPAAQSIPEFAEPVPEAGTMCVGRRACMFQARPALTSHSMRSWLMRVTHGHAACAFCCTGTHRLHPLHKKPSCHPM